MRKAIILALAFIPAPVAGRSDQLPDGYVLDAPPCPQGRSECNPFDRYPRVTPTQSPAIPPGPALLIISNHQSIRTVPYKSMKACERARRYVSGPPAGSPAPGGGVYGPPAVTYACVPR